jgi:hypothetical protein
MPLDQERLKNKLKTAYLEMQNSFPNAVDGLDILCAALASAVIEEVKELVITYQAGLTSPAGPVTGSFNYKIS